jgi:drug/metabolite transporter (DMT)-like permease
MDLASTIFLKVPPLVLALLIAFVFLSGDVPVSGALKQYGFVAVPTGIWLWFIATRTLASLAQFSLWTQGSLGIVNGLVAGLAILLSGVASVVLLHQPLTLTHWLGLAFIVLGVVLLSR